MVSSISRDYKGMKLVPIICVLQAYETSCWQSWSLLFLSQENERQMIKRLIQKREECQKLNAHFEELLAQHAKFKGMEGTEDIPLMSKKELIEKFRTVNKGYSKMSSCITNPNTSWILLLIEISAITLKVDVHSKRVSIFKLHENEQLKCCKECCFHVWLKSTDLTSLTCEISNCLPLLPIAMQYCF